MKNKIIKGISLRNNDWEKEITVQNRFQIFKAAGTTAQPSLVVPKNGAAKSGFLLSHCGNAVVSVHLHLFLHATMEAISSFSSFIQVKFVYILNISLDLMLLLDRQQDLAFSIIKALRNIHYFYPSCPSLG